MGLQFSLTDGNANILAQIGDDPGAVRLDADFYHVDDIHGVTEGLTGSGNLNYLVLQGRQTDETRADANPYETRNENLLFASEGVGGLRSDSHPAGNFYEGYHDANGDLNDLSRGLNLLQGGGGAQPALSHSALETFSGASSTAEHNNTLDLRGSDSSRSIFEHLQQAFNGDNGTNGLPGIGTNGLDGTGHDGRDGIDGKTPTLPPPEPPPGPPDITPDTDTDLNVHVDTPLVHADLGTVLDPLERVVGDIDINVNSTLDTSPLLDGHLPNVGLSIDPLLLGTHIPLVDTAPILDPLTGSVNHVLDALSPVTSPILDPVLGALPPEVTGLLDGGSGNNGIFITPELDALGLPIQVGTLGVDLNALEPLIGHFNLDLTPTLGALNPDGLLSADIGGLLNGQTLLDANLTDGITAPLDGTPLAGVLDPLQPVLDTVSDTVDQLLAPLQGVGGGLSDGSVDALNGVHGIVPVDELLGGSLDPLAAATTQLQDGAAGLTGMLGDTVNGLVDGSVGGLADGAGGGQMAGLLDPLQPVLDTVSGTADQLLAPLQGIGDSLSGGAADGLPVDSILGGSLDGVTAALPDIGGGLDPVSSIVEPVQDTLGTVLDGSILDGSDSGAAGDQLSSVLDQAQGALGDMTGGDSGSGLLDIVQAVVDTADTAVSQTVADLSNTVTDAAPQVTDGVNNILSLLGGDSPTAGVDASGDTTVSVDPSEGILNQLSSSLTDGLAAVTDTTLDATGSLASDVSSLLTGDAGAVSTDVSWPEAAAAPVADALSTVLGGSDSSSSGAAVLPDPVGSVVEGLHTVVDHSTHSSGHSLLGGLFG